MVHIIHEINLDFSVVRSSSLAARALDLELMVINVSSPFNHQEQKCRKTRIWNQLSCQKHPTPAFAA
jgi:hypothetical protein